MEPTYQAQPIQQSEQTKKDQVSRTNKWLKRLEELQDFKNREGHCRVPAKFDKNPGLGKWVSTQRDQYRNIKQGKPSSLDKSRIQALENIGFAWNVNKKKHGFRVPWMEQYERLKEFQAREGHCRVPQKYKKDPTLGRWVMSQRLHYKRLKQGKSRMPEERVKALDDIGFTWDVVGAKSEVWMRHFNSLLEFKKQEGHCRVPRSHFDDQALANWVNFQRKQYNYMKLGKPSLMTNERVKLLDSIGFTWNVYGEESETWMTKYEELKQFKEKEGHCVVPATFDKNPALGVWVVTQRQHYKYMKQGKSSIMTEQRVQLLNDINFVWNVRKSDTGS
mmetsp:Transcript_34724/g.42461  ORF Transcript_34724/g.42461 Transcript_34724/m.42461 type:complete len:333 (-) Transcript_34724:94-1092(-)